jgi:hypothetical protein
VVPGCGGDAPGPDLLSVPDSFVPGPDLTPDQTMLPDLPPDLGAAKDLPPGAGPEIGPDSRIGPDLATDPAPAGESASSCISAIMANGYQAGSAPACSACQENKVSLESKCEAMIQCLATEGPDLTDCLNKANADETVSGCVTAIPQAAGCPAAYY